MEAILSALEEEKKQASRLIQKYKKELGELPQGTFFIRKVGKNCYGYLTFSEKGIIQQKYMGRLSKDEINHYREMAERKKKLQELRGKAQKQLDFLEKTLRHAGKKSKRGS
jgi:hypothetical protein